jgi:hypothetical protein
VIIPRSAEAVNLKNSPGEGRVNTAELVEVTLKTPVAGILRCYGDFLIVTDAAAEMCD